MLFRKNVITKKIFVILFFICQMGHTYIQLSSIFSSSIDFGACSREKCEMPFCAEDCESPGACHVKDVDGICRPSCGYAAYLVGLGWGHYGPDGERKTSDDLFIYMSFDGSCEDLSVTYPDGNGITRDDWQTFDFYRGIEPHEVVENGGVCCRRED